MGQVQEKLPLEEVEQALRLCTAICNIHLLIPPLAGSYAAPLSWPILPSSLSLEHSALSISVSLPFGKKRRKEGE